MTQIRRQPLCPSRLTRSKESKIIEEGVGVWGGGGQRTWVKEGEGRRWKRKCRTLRKGLLLLQQQRVQSPAEKWQKRRRRRRRRRRIDSPHGKSTVPTLPLISLFPEPPLRACVCARWWDRCRCLPISRRCFFLLSSVSSRFLTRGNGRVFVRFQSFLIAEFAKFLLLAKRWYGNSLRWILHISYLWQSALRCELKNNWFQRSVLLCMLLVFHEEVQACPWSQQHTPSQIQKSEDYRRRRILWAFFSLRVLFF